MPKDINNFSVSAQDLLVMESRLCNELSRFINFSRHTIYFPKLDKKFEIEIIAREHKLFLPIVWGGVFLGTLLLEGISAIRIKPILSVLPELLNLCLKIVVMEHVSRIDSRTGLAREESFFSWMVQRCESLRAILADPSRSHDPLHKFCLGMLVITWPDSQRIANEFDYEFRDMVFAGLAAELKNALPPEAIAAPLGIHEGRHEFGIIFPANGRGVCQRLGSSMVSRLGKIPFPDIPSGKIFNATLHAGHAAYPQDMVGKELSLPIREQALRLRDRARFAGRQASPSSPVMAFAKLLRRGGRILKVMGGGQLLLNLGLAANARTGMRFEVHDAMTSALKGQIEIIETRVKDALAELIFVEDAGNLPESGDKLLFIDGTARSANKWMAAPIGSNTDPLHETSHLRCWSHGEFLAAFTEASRNCGRFTLAIARNIRDDTTQVPNEGNLLESMSQFLADIVQNKPEIAPGLSGRYGGNSFIFFHPESTAEKVGVFFNELSLEASKAGASLAIGIFQWPFLNFGKAESEIWAFRALEYAQLLPEPHIGVLDSVALTISADRHYSMGDVFAAIEDYKLALLADSSNILAKNSLGVCLAAIGKLNEARKLFMDAYEQCGEDNLKSKICFNLGGVFQKEDDHKNARAFYLRSLKLDPGHIYAALRLGRLYEQKGRKTSARRLYARALELADNVETANLAERHLARLDGGKKAREHLHTALLRDPFDSFSMLLLARSYLNEGGDPVMAELFARKCANISDNPEAWQVLTEALVAQGKNEEAQKTRIRTNRDFNN